MIYINEFFSLRIHALKALAFLGIALGIALPSSSSTQDDPRMKVPLDERQRLTAQDTRRANRRPRKTKPDVIYYPTPMETVAEMLRIAEIKKGDILYDLGSGDGRIPIAAAERYGIRAFGIEIDQKLIAEAEERAVQAGVKDLVSFRSEDLFRANISDATVVTIYLSSVLNLRLRSKLLRELRPGTRVVSHDFDMGDWKPEQTLRVPWQGLYRTIYMWRIPERARLK